MIEKKNMNTSLKGAKQPIMEKTRLRKGDKNTMPKKKQEKKKRKLKKSYISKRIVKNFMR